MDFDFFMGLLEGKCRVSLAPCRRVTVRWLH